MVPHFAASSAGLAVTVFGVIAAMGGLFQINPVWLWGPYDPAVVSTASQPDWYMFFLEGALRIFPAWEIRAFGHTVPAMFFPSVVLPALLMLLAFGYPWLERLRTHDQARHNLAQRPRDVPARTATGAMALTFYLVLAASGANDVIADKFHISLNAMVWAGRIAVLLAPPLAYTAAFRLALALQRHDRQVLLHGVETGRLRRAPDGRYYEIRQPLGPVDDRGDGTLPYAGWAVPKVPNRIGLLLPAVKGFFVPVERVRREPADVASGPDGGSAPGRAADGRSVGGAVGTGVVLEQEPARGHEDRTESR
jgi:ubiquinol-cytochrome c reductase cytochrome b subunit